VILTRLAALFKKQTASPLRSDNFLCGFLTLFSKMLSQVNLS